MLETIKDLSDKQIVLAGYFNSFFDNSEKEIYSQICWT